MSKTGEKLGPVHAVEYWRDEEQPDGKQKHVLYRHRFEQPFSKLPVLKGTEQGKIAVENQEYVEVTNRGIEDKKTNPDQNEEHQVAVLNNLGRTFFLPVQEQTNRTAKAKMAKVYGESVIMASTVGVVSTGISYVADSSSWSNYAKAGAVAGITIPLYALANMGTTSHNKAVAAFAHRAAASVILAGFVSAVSYAINGISDT